MRVLRKVFLACASAVAVVALGVAPASAHDASPGWLSGMSGDDVAAFEAFRGSPVEIRQVWMDSPALWNLAPGGNLAGYRGPLSVSLAVPEWTSWRDVAKGKQDKVWRATAKQLNIYRKGAAVTYVSPFWEFNGTWMPWSVKRTSKNEKEFRDGFARLSKIMRQEMPGVKILLDPHCRRTLPKKMLPKSGAYDVLACTTYNAFSWSPAGDVSLRDLERLRRRAIEVKKPIAITEWGNCGDSSARCDGGEAPVYMDRMHAWIKKNAGKGKGQLLFETYYNLDAAYLLVDEHTCMTKTQPATAREYARRFGTLGENAEPHGAQCPSPPTSPPPTSPPTPTPTATPTSTPTSTQTTP